MRFETTCVNARGDDIIEMVDGEREITRNTFKKHVDKSELRELEIQLGYEQHASRGLIMANDWHVSYHKSRYRGRPCVYFDWSAIEYVFT